jgi:hypothetical protein
MIRERRERWQKTHLEPHNAFLTLPQLLTHFLRWQTEAVSVVTLIRTALLESLASCGEAVGGAETVVGFAGLRRVGRQYAKLVK